MHEQVEKWKFNRTVEVNNGFIVFFKQSHNSSFTFSWSEVSFPAALTNTLQDSAGQGWMDVVPEVLLLALRGHAVHLSMIQCGLITREPFLLVSGGEVCIVLFGVYTASLEACSQLLFLFRSPTNALRYKNSILRKCSLVTSLEATVILNSWSHILFFLQLENSLRLIGFDREWRIRNSRSKCATAGPDRIKMLLLFSFPSVHVKLAKEEWKKN